MREICESSNTLTHLEIYEHLWDYDNFEQSFTKMKICTKPQLLKQVQGVFHLNYTIALLGVSRVEARLFLSCDKQERKCKK